MYLCPFLEKKITKQLYFFRSSDSNLIKIWNSKYLFCWMSCWCDRLHTINLIKFIIHYSHIDQHDWFNFLLSLVTGGGGMIWNSLVARGFENQRWLEDDRIDNLKSTNDVMSMECLAIDGLSLFVGGSEFWIFFEFEFIAIADLYVGFEILISKIGLFLIGLCSSTG